MTKTSVEIRSDLVETLRLDLIGPDNDHPFAEELLPEPPQRWYLTGFLLPTDAPISQSFDATSTEDLDAAESGGTDDGTEPDKGAASSKNHQSLLPSSMGLSVLVSAETKELKATVAWGDYDWESSEDEAEPGSGEKDTSAENQDPQPTEEGDTGSKNQAKALKGWRRTPNTREEIVIPLPEPGDAPSWTEVPASNGLRLLPTVRYASTKGLPEGTKSVSVFLVNARASFDDQAYRAYIFQASLELNCREGFVARPDPRGWNLEDEWDQRVADLQYRDVFEFAVGHAVSANAEVVNAACHTVRTVWIPTAEVEHVAASNIELVELGMEKLGALSDGDEAGKLLLPLVTQYRTWIDDQEANLPPLAGTRHQTAMDMFVEARKAADRIEAGIALLKEEDALEAFRIANRAVARAFRQREAQNTDHNDPEKVATPRWRPFQLAYLLMTIRGVAQPDHSDRERVDLLFFPTGGGKTEAYLALAAFTLVLRRFRSKGQDGKPTFASAGVSILMRYTLRLLTLDQLGRATGLICALELERQQNPSLLGDWPFEIGLWVGSAATPNLMGKRGDRSSRRIYTAYTKTRQFKQDDRKPSPIPLEQCPWCGTKFSRNSFRLVPNIDNPTDLRIHCANHECIFSRDHQLPIVAVDEPIYRRLPCFIIATVDKFANLPWIGRTGGLFGKVERFDKEGFYGRCDPGIGTAIPGGELPAPDLIIQDELHLISGPLGTIAGLYETVIDALASRNVGGKSIRPKIIASTATVRRADSQIRALFGRSQVTIFPPPGPDRRDSFFAETKPPSHTAARQYIGITAQGRALKVVLLRSSLALLSAGRKAWQDAGGDKAKPLNPADPYMTLLGYFNSLRELGGSRRIVEDEVRTRLSDYWRRRRKDPKDDLFVDRYISYDVLELTSRESTSKVAEAKRKLSLTYLEEKGKEKVDVAMATNMISVGLDIVRLGLMVVLGQPKATAEYIQATSRVGRDPQRPGLVVTLLNIHKARDRSHYERFTAFHDSFYRNVEATSVTPFSPRALDRTLVAALVTLCRHQIGELTAPAAAQEILHHRSELDTLSAQIAERAENHRLGMTSEEKQELRANVLHRCSHLLDSWVKIANQASDEGSAIQYQREENAPPRRLLYEFLHPDLEHIHQIHSKFRANRSMRDVEAPVEVQMQNLNDWGDEDDA
ncbi:MAG: DISARM system helicase DrmA [Planctomycetota bacterium]|nr:DISARM system helicase DrmA [Planctomycetota bacterium]